MEQAVEGILYSKIIHIKDVTYRLFKQWLVLELKEGHGFQLEFQQTQTI